MRKLTKYELEVLKNIETELNFGERVLLNIFKKYSFKILQIGVRYKFFKE